MALNINPSEGRAERLAPWIREMDLADQVFITGTTLVFEDIPLRRDSFPVPFNEANLREGTPAEVYSSAIALSEAYAKQPVHPGDDGMDEHWRLSNLAREIAEHVARYHPEVVGGGH